MFLGGPWGLSGDLWGSSKASRGRFGKLCKASWAASGPSRRRSDEEEPISKDEAELGTKTERQANGRQQQQARARHVQNLLLRQGGAHRDGRLSSSTDYVQPLALLRLRVSNAEEKVCLALRGASGIFPFVPPWRCVPHPSPGTLPSNLSAPVAPNRAPNKAAFGPSLSACLGCGPGGFVVALAVVNHHHWRPPRRLGHRMMRLDPANVVVAHRVCDHVNRPIQKVGHRC